MHDWMIYGATGYTGQLVAGVALERGHRPLLAGRSTEKLKPLARKLGLDYVVFGLEKPPLLSQYGVNLLLNCAGPFIYTADPLQQACLRARVHYLDLTVETSVFEQTLTHNAAAQDRGIVMMSGAGFNIIPTDCLAKLVTDQVESATVLEIFLDLRLLRGELGVTSGTLKSMLEMLPSGVRARQDGLMTSYGLGSHGKQIGFPDGVRRVMPVPCGDACTGYLTTGIPNITAYIALPTWTWYGLRYAGRLVQQILHNTALRRWLRRPLERLVHGPSEARRSSVRALIGARAVGPDGQSASAWLETLEPYYFSALAALHTVEQVFVQPLRGATTPSMAFGANYVWGIEGVRQLG